MGIRLNNTVEMVILSHRRRRHRVESLNNIELKIQSIKYRGQQQDEDITLWRCKGDSYKPRFNSKETWRLVRTPQETVDWSSGIWLAHNTPKYAFIAWLAVHNRLATGDRVQRWNPQASASCALCSGQLESRSHIFFECSYSDEVWTKLFLVRYVFQAALYSLWRERNSRTHGELPLPAAKLVTLVEKMVRNRISSIWRSTHTYEDAMNLWFTTR
ncbi:hypothetical protein Bca101_004794 [Brassica carinata]